MNEANLIDDGFDVDDIVDDVYWLSTDQLGEMFTMSSTLGNSYPKAVDWNDYQQDIEDHPTVQLRHR